MVCSLFMSRKNTLLKFDVAVKAFKNIFIGLEPHPHLRDPKSIVEEDLNKRFCIMNRPNVLMNIPLLGFNRTAYAEQILQQCEAEPDPRFKQLFATVRGMGGGKTRALEEIRRELYFRDGVLALAITFNSDWEARRLGFDSWNNFNVTPAVFYSLSVISRMASMFYEIELGFATALLERHSFIERYGRCYTHSRIY